MTNLTRMMFTIGTQGQHDAPFLKLLNHNSIDAVIDIRRRNEGRYYKFASGRHIRALVEGVGLAYCHELAFAPTVTMLNTYRADGDWASYVPAYQQILDDPKVLGLWHAQYGQFRRPCLLCAEAVPTYCHRGLLARFLSEAFGVEVVHLIGARCERKRGGTFKHEGDL